MSVTARFERFFAAANDGNMPYPWQCELVEQVADTGLWPDIAAPTGTGKSSVIDAHVFLVAEHAAWFDRDPDAHQVARPPRRLVMVAPRRVLVDDQFERANQLAKRLREAVPDSVLGSAARTLRSLCTSVVDPNAKPNDPLRAWRVRGGVRMETGWRQEPAACQVICATPQMWGSRLLFRGYAATRNARNLESGLLGYDTVAVIDEAHLHERLLETGRRIAALPWGSDGLQVIGMSATARHVHGQLRLSDADFEEPRLRRRVDASKHIGYVEVDDLKRDAVRALSEAAQAAKADGTVGVFVNDVPTALAVSAALRKDGSIVETICGRMRSADLACIEAERPGLLTAVGNADVDFLVSTQSLEVGVDLDLGRMVSTIAPPSALAQRAGRLNRSGSRDDSVFTVVTVVGLADRDPDRTEDAAAVPRSGPYEGVDLIHGARWLRSLGGSISPRRVAEVGLPAGSRTPVPVPAIRQVDLETLMLTSNVQPADPDPDLYIQDPGEPRNEIGVAARRHLGLESEVVQEMLEACPPRSHELATLSLDAKSDLHELFERLPRMPEAQHPDAWVVRTVDGELRAQRIARYQDLLPGDALVVPDGAPICVGRIVGLGPAKGVGSPMRDVLELAPDDAGRDWIIAMETAAIVPVLDLDPALGGRAARVALAEVLARPADGDHADAEPRAGQVEAASRQQLADRLRDRKIRLAETELRWCAGADAEHGLLVARDLQRRGELSEGSTADEPVSIAAHHAAVEERAADIIRALKCDLAAEQGLAVRLAARLHDEGKQHPAFQSRMGRRALDPPLAKPLPGHRPALGDGWRHEQLSAAYVAALVADADLAVVLVAAHHGRGRGLFDRGAEELLVGFDDCPPDVRAQAEALFGDAGRYELLRAAVTRQHGGYRLAWLEALLRCADVQVSKEGH